MIPSFAREYPDDPALNTLVQSFARGDYRAVRDGAKRLLAAETTDDAVRAAATELVLRTGAGRTTALLFAVASIALALVWGYWLLRGR